jgi:RNA polymerase sigma factor (TIGR02999 family)
MFDLANNPDPLPRGEPENTGPHDPGRSAVDRLGLADRPVDELLPLVYAELRSLAGRYLRSEDSGHTLQSTALVHEAFVRLVEGDRRAFVDRAHLFGAAAIAIRRVLVDHARKRSRLKRGGNLERVPFEEVDVPSGKDPGELIALDEALERLASLDPVKARVVELRFFAGLSVDEVAAVLRISASTVSREWRFARAWLRTEIESRSAA